MPSASQQDV
jgi:hypothetical protein